MMKGKSMIKVLGLSKIYQGKESEGPAVKALDNVSFTLGNKGLVFILGRSGGGKSTLLNLLGGLDTIDYGDISVNDTFLASLDGPSLDSYRNTYVGFVFQEYNILEDKTVKENVALALSLQGKKDETLVNEALQKVSMLELASRKASDLSGGQKQRVAIARAIVKKPTLLLADEPTGALDFETGTQIMNLLKEVSLTQLVVVVSHDRSFAEKYGDRIIEIENGRIIADSNPFESEEKVESLPLVKSRIRFGQSLGMAAKSLKSKVSRLALTSLLSIVSFAAFGVLSAASSWNKNEATYSAIENADNKTVAITCSNEMGPVLIPQTKINKIKAAFKDKVFVKECVGVDIYGDEIADVRSFEKGPNNDWSSIDYSSLGNFYSGKIYGYTYFNEDDLASSGFKIAGRLPVSDNEIAISQYTYNYFKTQQGIFTYEGVSVNLDINGLVNKNYSVVGVIDTDFKDTKYRNQNVRGNDGLKFKDYVYDELKNSFNGMIFLNENMYEFAKSRDDSTVRLTDGEVSVTVTSESLSLSLEDLYTSFIGNKEIDYYRSNSLYYLVDFENKTIRLTRDWFSANGYTFNSNNGTYTKTISDPNGDYDVTYDAIGVRTSEREDPNLTIPERANITTTRREFLDAQFVASSQSEKDSLLANDNAFAPLDDNEIIVIVDNTFSPLYTDFVSGKRDVSFAIGEETINAKVKAVCVRKDATNNNITNSQIVASQKIGSTISEKISGYYRLIAKLSKDAKTNREFFDFCTKEEYIDATFEMANIAETAITRIDSVLNGPTIFVALAFSVALAVLSSLILMNFIGISMSYGKREMGILRALGARNSDVLLVYLLEGIIIALFNGVLAFVGATIACSIVNAEIAASFEISIVALSFSPFVPLTILGLSLLSSLLAVSLPIWKNRNKKPIETLTNR